jgi:hypothetical protein
VCVYHHLVLSSFGIASVIKKKGQVDSKKKKRKCSTIIKNKKKSREQVKKRKKEKRKLKGVIVVPLFELVAIVSLFTFVTFIWCCILISFREYLCHHSRSPIAFVSFLFSSHPFEQHWFDFLVCKYSPKDLRALLEVPFGEHSLSILIS